jgi:hypothetical protein
MGTFAKTILRGGLYRHWQSRDDIPTLYMNTLPSIGALVRRIEPPTYGLATVAEVDDSGSHVCYMITYSEGGDGWWPGDCLEVVPAAEV